MWVGISPVYSILEMVGILLMFGMGFVDLGPDIISSRVYAIFNNAIDKFAC